ncbi:MAG: hypothetical protein P4L79_08560 [Legionella sp.]|uniref:hypothetical protein n=1 Tax=Legionella sp. TaxID=459 RepID=UPI00283E37EB|nr:hypothetical protein [Legionella sp.]
MNELERLTQNTQDNQLPNATILHILINHINENYLPFLKEVIASMRAEQVPLLAWLIQGRNDTHHENFQNILNIFISERQALCTVENMELLIAANDWLPWLEEKLPTILLEEDKARPVHLQRHLDAEIKRRKEEQDTQFMEKIWQEAIRLNLNTNDFKAYAEQLKLREKVGDCRFTPKVIAFLYAMKLNSDIFLKCLDLNDPKVMHAITNLITEIPTYNRCQPDLKKKIIFGEFLDETTFTLLNKAQEPVYFTTTLIELHDLGLKEKEIIEQFLSFPRSDKLVQLVSQCIRAGLSKDLCKQYLFRKDKADLFTVLAELAIIEKGKFKQDLIDKVLNCFDLRSLCAKLHAYKESTLNFFNSRTTLTEEDIKELLSGPKNLTEENFEAFLTEVNQSAPKESSYS